jgi:hypothetical protein
VCLPVASATPSEKSAEVAAHGHALTKAEMEAYRQLYLQFREQILDAAVAGDKAKVEKIIDQFRASTARGLLWVGVTRTRRGAKSVVLVAKHCGDGAKVIVAVSKTNFADRTDPHVAIEANAGRPYVHIQSAADRDGKFPHDLYITMAVDPALSVIPRPAKVPIITNERDR